MSVTHQFHIGGRIKWNRLEASAVTAVAAFFTVVLFVSGIAPILNFVPTTNQKFAAALPANTHSANIFFSPQILPKTQGMQTASIYVDTGGNTIGNVTMKMKYNPKVMQIASLVPQNFNKQPYSTTFSVQSIQNDSKNGVLTYVVNAQQKNNNYPLPPIFRIATVTFSITGSSNGNYISFLPGTAIYPTTGTAVAGVASTPTSILGSVVPLQSAPTQ